MNALKRNIARFAAIGTAAALVTILPTTAAFAGTSDCKAPSPIGEQRTVTTSTFTYTPSTVYVGDPVTSVALRSTSAIPAAQGDLAMQFYSAKSVIGSSTVNVYVGGVAKPTTLTIEPANMTNGQDTVLHANGTFSVTPTTTPGVIPLKTGTDVYVANTTFQKGTNGGGGEALAVVATCTPRGEDPFGGITVKSRSATMLNTIGGPVTAGSTRQVPVSVTVVGGAVAGKARLIVDGVERSLKTVTAGATTLTLDDLTQGSHTVRAEFVPNDATLYEGSRSTIQTINVLPPAVDTTTTLTLNKSTIGSSEALVATAKVTAPSGSPQGTVDFLIDGVVSTTKPYGAGDTQVAGTFTGLSTGIHDVQARFNPTSPISFTASESGVVPVVVRAPSTPTTTVVTLPKNPASSTDLISPTATVSSSNGPPAGTVQFFVDGSSVGPATTVGSDGKATRTLGKITTPGEHLVTAEFSPANVSQFENSVSAPVSLTITAPGTPTTTTMTLSSTSGTSADPITATVNVGANSGSPVGSVKISVDGNDVANSPVANGTATIALPALDAGTHTVRATFAPTSANDFQASASAIESVTITSVTSTTALSLTPETASAGSDIAAVATVSTSAGNPAGVVEFFVDATLVAQGAVGGAGKTTVNLPPLSEGAYEVTARFVPVKPNQQTGSTSNAVSLTLTQPVQANPTTTVATLSESTVTVADEVTVSVDVTASGATPSGTVAVTINGQTLTEALTGGHADVVVPPLPIGDYEVVAKFTATNAAIFESSDSASLPLQVVRAAVTTFTSLSLTPSTAVEGESVTATASVSSSRGSAVGDVVFTVDGGADQSVAVSDRTASLVLGTLGAGEHTIRARFVPSNRLNYTASSALARSVTVASTPTTATATGLTLAPSTIDAGDSAVITVTVNSASGTPTGTVEVLFDGELLTAALTNGVAQLTSPAYLPVGSVAVSAKYLPAGASGFAPSQSTTRTLTINQAPEGGTVTSTALTLSPSEPTVGDDVVAVASVAWIGGQPAGTVSFSIDGVPHGSPVTVTDGVARLALPALSARGYLIGADFVPADPALQSGSSTFAPVTVAAKAAIDTMTVLSLADDTITENGSTTATARVTAASGTQAPVGSVIFTIDGDDEAPVVLTAGVADLLIDGLDVGSREVLARFAPDTNAFRTSTSRPEVLTVTDDAPQVVAAATTTSLSLGAATATPTDLVSATVRVTAVTGTDIPVGQARLKVGQVVYRAPLVNGKATFSLPPLGLGAHAVEAGFEPAAGGFMASTATAQTITITAPVAPAQQPVADQPAAPAPAAKTTATTTTLVGVALVPLGSQMSLTATVSGGTPNGQVRFSTGGALVTVPVVNGRATGSLKAIAMGSSSATATFIPADATHSPSWATATYTVGRATTAAGMSGKYSKKKWAIDVVASLSVVGDMARTTGKVKFVVKADGRKILGTTTPIPATGVVKRNFNKLPKAKTYTVTVTYRGSATTTPVTATTTIKGPGKKKSKK